jgi:hypothetical protein
MLLVENIRKHRVQVLKSDTIGVSKLRSARKHRKNKCSSRSGTDDSTSETDSSSSSSNSTVSSSSSDSDRFHRSSKRRSTCKHHSRSPKRYAKQIIKNVGKDGFVVYLNHWCIVMVSQNAGKLIIEAYTRLRH